MKNVKVALVQAAPVLFDLEQTLNKVNILVDSAAKEQADLILFPEAFVSAYPRGLTFGTVVGSRNDEGRALWMKYWDSSISVPGPETDYLGKIARKASSILVIGVIEKGSSGTLYCTLLYFDRTGKLIGKHRKLKPTAAERIIWGEGDGSDLQVFSTSLGNVGGLICWENYMPLARTWLYQQNIEIYLAPTADQRESWQATMRHIACEGRCFVLGCNQYVTKSDYPEDLPGENVSQLPDVLSRGGSVIIDPLGNVLAGPLWDKDGILYHDLDGSLITQSRLDFDAVGHYDRPDVFKLTGPL